MEFAERRRSRKSQSFKLINDQEFESECFDSDVNSAVNGESKEGVPEAWLEDEGKEIKRQITGMMRVLNDKAGRVYQRVGREGENLKQEPQDELLSWASTADLEPEVPQHSSWTCSPQPSNHPTSGQYSTRSKTQKVLNRTKDLSNSNDMALPQPYVVTTTKSSCCMCNCKTTLQAILLELRSMRKMMQTQKGTQEKQVALSNTCSARCPVTRKRARKRRPVHRVAPLTKPVNGAAPSSQPPTSPLPHSSEHRERTVSAPLAPALSSPASTSVTPPISHYSPITGPNSAEPEVQLADDYDVFIPKSQLDSILVNYTRSGSLLFRKLVCAFFDDTTLANSLPNGKRKRGLNDHRKGLDQNIVGAIKVFTEKYCTANRIEKLPGARDWVQILQDQIKLARRRLKRAETAADAEETRNRPPSHTTESPEVSTQQKNDHHGQTGGDCGKPDSVFAMEMVS
ncbi:BEN domain-containing protein 7 isoform X2 [Clupea harengus]|uniref:BEN domain-containing protein 7 isoform X2 n=1 Tax=Clupea harengus TaxID=7950 RepID=A0A6P8F8S6_CLUHA|nr:BEN domain-containing protein 7 isoform X2 [Clupea harengus]